MRAPGGSGCGDGAGDAVHPAGADRDHAWDANAACDPRDNALAGRIRRCSFLGNILRYAVEIDGIAPVTVDLQNAVGVAPLPVGAPVVLRWPVADSLILPAEP